MDQSSSGGQSDRQGSDRSRGNRNRRRRRNPGNQANRQNQSASNSGGGQNRRSSKKKNQNRRPNRYRGSNRRKPAPKPTLGQKILSFLTFGLLGKSGASKPKKKRKTQRTQPKPTSSHTDTATARVEQSQKRPSRKALMEDVTSPRLYVGNLVYEAHEADLEQLFKGVGNVVSAEIVTNPRTQQSKGFGFVEMSHIEEARRAVTILHDQDFMGRKLLVSGARSEGPKARSEKKDEEAEEAEVKEEAEVESTPAEESKAVSAPEPKPDPGEADSAAA